MDTGKITRLDPEAVAYTLMGIGHFIAMRWLIWPSQDQASQEELPEEVFESMMALIAHGLSARQIG
jgi:hypothetical protein